MIPVLQFNRILGYGRALRQPIHTCRTTPRPHERIAAPLDREGSRAGEGDVAAFEGHRALSGLEDDFFLGEDVDFVVAAGHGKRLVGEDFELVGVGLEGVGSGLGDALDAAGVAEPAGGFADAGGEGVGGGDMQVVLDCGVQVGAGVEQGAGRAGQADVAGGFGDDEGLGEAFGRVGEFAAAGAGFLRRLAADAGGEFASFCGSTAAMKSVCA